MNRKICVVGGGRWGKNHIRTLNSLGCLSGIVDSDENVLRELKEIYPNVETHTNIKDAVERNYDGFTVATPAETHFDIAKYILEHKKPVLVEKPLALTVRRAVKLDKLSRDNGMLLMVGHVLLFHPAIKKIKQLIDLGKIGKIEYLYSNRLNLGTVRTEENILWSFAPHDIAIFQYFIGSKPLEINSKGGAFLQSHIHDTTMTMLKYPDNIIGHIFVSWLHPFKEQRLVVIGSKGMLSFEDSSEKKEIFFYEKGIDWIQGEPVKRDGPTEVIEYNKSMPLTEELKYFIEHLDRSSCEISNGQSAVEVLEILEKATQSLRSKETIGINEESEVAKPFIDVFIHPSSFVDNNVEIGERTKIWHFSHVQSHTKIGRKCSLGQNVNVGNNVIIGDYVKIQNNVSVYEGVILEDYVFCGPSMVFTNVKDPRCKYPQRGSKFYLKTLVKEGASIGANATIICGNIIGKHAFIAAGAIVTKDVPDYALMVGIPAKRKGWVCECGMILSSFDNIVICLKCGLKYKLKELELLVLQNV